MTKYAKIIEGRLEFAPKNKGSIINYDLDTERLIQDGYKPYVPAEIPTTNRRYHFDYTETSESITEILVYDETQAEADARDLENAKRAKISENDTVRDAALNRGVTYEGILFDSDTDQKINLLATVNVMGDEDEVTWFGMNNEALLCTKADLMQIGGLIIELHTFCWTKNAEIKGEIAAAETLQEVEEIEVDYDTEE